MTSSPGDPAGPPAGTRPPEPSPTDGLPGQPSDLDILRRVRAGDTAAYGQLFARYQHRALRYATRITRQPDDAMDLVAEAFTKVLAIVMAGGGPDRYFPAYLFRTIRHTSLENYRAVALDVPVADIHDANSRNHSITTISTEDLFEARELIGAAFHALPQRWRQIIWDSVILGLESRHLAVPRELSPNAAAALRARALKGLHAQVQELLLDEPD